MTIAMIDILSEIRESTSVIDKALLKYFDRPSEVVSVLTDAEIYGVMSGGKRIRPFLTLEFCRLFGGEQKAALPFACAVELIHSYSLIHDDLPCMDDDDMRRGKPSCHKKFGEANALLAGDALLTYAFEICASNRDVSSDQVRSAVSVLAHSAGSFGMVGGQVIDLYGEDHEIDFETLLTLHKMKTGALIGAAVKLGCVAAGYAPDSQEYLDSAKYAECVGLTFQIIDDILDAREGSEKEEKTTFLTFMNEEEAYKYAEKLSSDACEAIGKYNNSDRLIALANFLLKRDK